MPSVSACFLQEYSVASTPFTGATPMRRISHARSWFMQSGSADSTDVGNTSDSHKNRAEKVTHTIAGFLDTVRLRLPEGFVSKVWCAAENTEIVVFMLSTSESFSIQAIVKDPPERSVYRPCIKLCGGETDGQQLHEGKDSNNIVHVGRLEALNHGLAKDKSVACKY
ncbi:hypothetical protein C8J57DRAFT_1248957 [Mycena rebaudengoi]|nr:hypothetical protein C8J57DRAFT_1248957 [Mycena rebaudengoi]